MKKYIILLTLCIIDLFSFSQVTVQMEKDGGVYKVPCTVNGVKMKFIFDTGAATVSMSQTMAQFLLDGEYMSKDDIKGVGQSQLADGSIVNHAIIILRDIEIGGMHIHDIDATVIEGQNAPLLLGQTAISELGRLSIDGNKLIIHINNTEASQKRIDNLKTQIDRYYDAGSYAAATDCLLQLESISELDSWYLYVLCYCYYADKQWDHCINSCKEWLSKYEQDIIVTVLQPDAKGDLYYCLGDCYLKGKQDNYSALTYYQKALNQMEQKSSTDSNNQKNLIYCSFMIANCYFGLANYQNAIKYYKKTIHLHCEYQNTSIEMVKQGLVNDDNLGQYLYNYSMCYYRQDKEDDGDEIMKLSALCGYQSSIDFCKKYNINYQTKSNKLFD